MAPSRPFNVPGLSRDNAPARAVDPGMIARVSSGMRAWLNMVQAPGGRELPFFPPGRPQDPVAPGAAGRAWDYPTSVNLGLKPRSYAPVDFDTLRALADPGVGGWDLIRLAIETRKDQMSKLTYSVLPRKQANQQLRAKSDPRCEQVERFLRRPDGHHAWADWVRMLLEEHLVIDAASIYGRKALDGSLARLEIIDGATIKPVIGYDGRRPEGDAPAYQQVLKGLPAVNYSASELIYAPRNPRTHTPYGYSPTEQVLVTVSIGLRRQASQLGFFTEGNVPDAISQVPPEWSIQKISEWQAYWDTIVNDAVNRRKMKFVPGGVSVQMTRNDQALVDQFDEWLARVVQYCFSLPPTPLVRMMNRATSESAYEQALEEGLQPLMTWIKNIIDDVIVRWFGFPDLEMVFDDVRKTDPAEKEERDVTLVNEGVISLDDIRADRGLEPLGVKPFVRGIGPLGFMSIDSIKKAMDNGWDLTGMPQPQMPGMPGVPPGSEAGLDGSIVGTGQPGDPLAGVSPDILAALGLGEPAPQAGIQRIDPNAPPEAAAPASGPPMHQHPEVLAALRDGEAHAKRVAAGGGR